MTRSGLETLSPKCEASTVEVSIGPNGSRAYLEGGLFVKPETELENGDIIFKLPPALRPRKVCWFPLLTSGDITALEVTPAGEVAYAGGPALKNHENIFFDGIDWPLT